jgi:stage II sporulation protein R
MKKIIAFAFVLVAVICAAVYLGFGTAETATAENDYLRIHVRANSNEQIDQNIKYKVKDEVVKFITPYITECVDKPAAMEVIGGILDGIEDVCDRTLRANGFSYTSKAQIRTEEFPTRVYGELTLEAGVYDALIVELGSGTGDNWWCVIYPPLCFTSASTDVEYRSIIKDIIDKFFN